MQSLQLSAKIPAYHDTFLGNLSSDLEDSIYKAQNRRFYFMEESNLNAPGKASIYPYESAMCSR